MSTTDTPADGIPSAAAARPVSPAAASPAPESPETLPAEPATPKAVEQMPGEIGGPSGPEPTRFGDWEFKGRCSDF